MPLRKTRTKWRRRSLSWCRSASVLGIPHERLLISRQRGPTLDGIGGRPLNFGAKVGNFAMEVRCMAFD